MIWCFFGRLVGWVSSRIPLHVPGTDRFGGPGNIVGRRICVVEMRGCMGETRGKEDWGEIIKLDVGRTERGLVYDGGASQETRAYRRRRGEDTWALVKYDNGVYGFVPVWWLIDKKSHLEYQT